MPGLARRDKLGLQTWREVFELQPHRVEQGGDLPRRQGGGAPKLFLIAEGVLKLWHESDQGEAVVVGFRRSGHLIALDQRLFDEHPVFFTALTDSLLYQIRVPQTGRAATTGSSLQAVLLHQMRAQNDEILAELAESRQLSARARFESLLGRFADLLASHTDGEGATFRMPISAREMALLISVTPEHLSRIKRQMETEGKIICQGRSWTVRHRRPLHAAGV